MRRSRALQLVAVLLAAAVIFTVTISSTQNTASTKLNGTQVEVKPADVVWEKTFGGAGDDRAFYTLPLADGYLIVGSSRSPVQNTTDGWVLRLDTEGNAVWNKTYSSGLDTELRCALAVSGGYLLVGNEFYLGDVNGYVARIDTQGTLLWNRTVGGDLVDKLFSAIPDADGCVAIGLTNAIGGASAWAVKLDLNGNIVWNLTSAQGTDVSLRSGVLTVDGGYLMAGYTSNGISGSYDFYLQKVNANGGLLWNRTYGGAENERAYSVASTPGGYVLVGDIDSPYTATDAWVVKVDLDGNMVWNRTFGGANADSPAFITPAQDGGYLIAGFTFSFGAGQRDFWLTKLDASGQAVWSCTLGDEAFQEAYSVIETGTNQYVLVGWTDPPAHPELAGVKHYDFYVAKISPPQAENGLNLQVIVYLVVVSGLLVAALAVLLRLRLSAPSQKSTV